MAYCNPQVRRKALDAVKSGHSKKAVNEMFGLGKNTLKTWEELEAETGGLENRPLNRAARKINREELLKQWKENPDATVQEMADKFGVSKSGIREADKILKITRKKKRDNTANEVKN